MAAYLKLSMVPVTEIIGPTRSRTVYEITAQAVASGVVFYHRLVKADITATNLDLILGTLAKEFNELAALPGVVGVDVDQDLNSQQVLDQKVHVTVESTDGTLQGEVTLQWGEFMDKRGVAKVKAERTWLNSLSDG